MELKTWSVYIDDDLFAVASHKADDGKIETKYAEYPDQFVLAEDAEKAIRRHKFRRCQDMVKYCYAYRESLNDDKMDWEKCHRLYLLYTKLIEKWKKLAEQFKALPVP